MSLQDIKDSYAVGKGYSNWTHLLEYYNNSVLLDEHIEEVMKIYAMECLKLASENAEADYESWRCGSVNAYVVSESITNENNIIK